VNNETKAEFECICGYKWQCRPSFILGKRGKCPVCSGHILTEEVVRQRLIDSGNKIQMIGKYLGSLTKTEFKCDLGHIWAAPPNRVIRGSNCPSCSLNIISDKKRLSLELINDKLIGRNIRLIGEYTNNKTKTLFECGDGHNWEATPGSIFNGHGCPFCCEYGGFNPGKPGYIYILDFGEYIKYGITNKLKKRMKQHRSNGNYNIVFTKLYDDGRIAQNWEKNIKIILGGRFVSKEIMPHGWTETLSKDKLQHLLETIV
jgi:hypothetical protein